MLVELAFDVGWVLDHSYLLGVHTGRCDGRARTHAPAGAGRARDLRDGGPDRTRELLTSAGFGDPQIEFVEIAFTFDDLDQYWDFLVRLAGALAMTIAALREDRGYRLSGVCLNAVAS